MTPSICWSNSMVSCFDVNSNLQRSVASEDEEQDRREFEGPHLRWRGSVVVGGGEVVRMRCR